MMSRLQEVWGVGKDEDVRDEEATLQALLDCPR